MDTNKIICFTLALALFSSYAAPHSYVERDGVVAIEAEDYTERDGAWQIVEGRNATAQGSGITRDFKMHLNGAASGSAPVELPSLQPFLWGIPGPMAKTYATLDVDRGRVTAFLYPRGAQMPGGAAPATRAALFLLPTNAPGALAQVFSQVVSDSLGGAQGQRAALIGIRTNLVGTDARLKSALESSGLAVTAFDEKQATADALREFQLVAISETAHAEKLHGGVLGLAVPIISFDPQTLQRLGMVKQRSAQLHENAVLISYGAWTNHVRYAIYFSQPGAYKLWLYGRDGGEGGANEVKVFFNTNEISARSGSFFEMKLPTTNGWTDVATFRRPENRKTPGQPILNVPAPGWCNLYLVKGSEPESHTGEIPTSRRYPNWRFDKISLFRDTSARPQGDGPAVTPNRLHELPAAFTPSEHKPPKTYDLRQGYAVIEAEELSPHTNWVFKAAPAGFSGAGYLEWRGPNRNRSVEGHGGGADTLGVQQGPREEWLLFRVKVPENGKYRVDLRNHHLRDDGDNDAWVGSVDSTGRPQLPVQRVGDNLRDGPGFSWLDWGVLSFELTQGEHTLYVGGRSIGFGIDRVAIYRDGDEEAKASALNAPKR